VDIVAFKRHLRERNLPCVLFGLCAFAALPVVMTSASRQEIVVGAASNLTAVFQALGPAFEAETGIRPIFTFASTAQLARQIENGAPIDVFAAADEEHVRDLAVKKLLLPNSVSTYADGALALWIPPSGRAVRGIEDLTQPQVRTIALANPKLAPYGEAAVEAMTRAKIWERVKDKIVYAENINMARQFGASGNADAVFTAYPLVTREKGTVLKVDAKLYEPIRQALGIVSATRDAASAQRFVEFLLHGKGRQFLKDFGYSTPRR
jgi:molybdate transport system substrate-binding protein